jgi:hypothetical protein
VWKAKSVTAKLIGGVAEVLSGRAKSVSGTPLEMRWPVAAARKVRGPSA